MGLLEKDQDTSSTFQPFAAGPEVLEISQTEWKATKAGDGHYLNMDLVVIKGKNKGRKLWHTLNLDNPSSDAVQIAKKEAQQMIIQIHGSALDVDSVKHLQKLLKGGKIEAMIKIQESKGYAPKNVIQYMIMEDGLDADTVDSSDKKPKKSKPKSVAPPWEQDDTTTEPEKKAKKKKKKKGKKSQE